MSPRRTAYCRWAEPRAHTLSDHRPPSVRVSPHPHSNTFAGGCYFCLTKGRMLVPPDASPFTTPLMQLPRGGWPGTSWQTTTCLSDKPPGGCGGKGRTRQISQHPAMSAHLREGGTFSSTSNRPGPATIPLAEPFGEPTSHAAAGLQREFSYSPIMS
ncbi:hypothetical protein LY78DRAFT_211857 [Colletotrichum sublineola]|nr:hypothetical protein LY78DRAFT_211857 [Colletotrichum sublineola]